jgi:hypothetical protein
MKKNRHGQKGQFVVETVLLMVVTISLFMWGTDQLRSAKVMAKLFSGPWGKISGMTESGVWEEPGAAQKKHPNQNYRSNTVDPE